MIPDETYYYRIKCDPSTMKLIHQSLAFNKLEAILDNGTLNYCTALDNEAMYIELELQKHSNVSVYQIYTCEDEVNYTFKHNKVIKFQLTEHRYEEHSFHDEFFKLDVAPETNKPELTEKINNRPLIR